MAPPCYRKGILVVALSAFLMPSASIVGAEAQQRSLERDGMHSKNLLILRHLAPTGAVVPKVGQPQIGPATGINRQIQHQDNQITHSICSNCGP